MESEADFLKPYSKKITKQKNLSMMNKSHEFLKHLEKNVQDGLQNDVLNNSAINKHVLVENENDDSEIVKYFDVDYN